MRIIYCTDVHGAYERVKELLYETIADVFIISGDLIDIPFYNMDSAIRYHELQMHFDNMRKQMGRDDVTVEDFVEVLMDMPHITEETAELGAKYQQYTIRARRVMQQKYKVLANIFSFKPQSYIYALPGNYDMDLKYTSLHDRDLHFHWYQAEDQIIAGYGGADVFTAGIPQKYIVPYKAGIGIDDRKNEMYNFFKAVRPSIIVTHQPAHGVLDWLAPVGPTGSPALRTYCDNNPVVLCLTGHIHGSWGIKEVENTLYMNPSPFGDITTVHHDVVEGGFFYQIEINGREVEQVLYRKIYNERVYDLAHYEKKNGRWSETIIDEGRYTAKQALVNVDMNIQQYSHIPEIELFKDIKNFFRMFQTEESELRVEKLEEIVRRIEPHVEDMAMDVVGSVNVGLSQPSSDIDIVLYLRCNQPCHDNLMSCECCSNAAHLIRSALNEEYKFEVLDCIDINVVEKNIRERNYESEALQRFVAYRSICRPINYRAIAPLEDMLNQDIEFRKEVEGSIRSYFRIFVATSQHIRSFKKYESRLKAIGIRLPESIRRKIVQYLQSEEEQA